MSLKEKILSSALSTLSMNTPRVTVDVTINSEQKGIKTYLYNYFIKAKVFAKIQRTDTGITKATIQGHPGQFPSTLESLKDLLNMEYDAAIVWGETRPVEEPNRLDSVLIEDTKAELKRNFSSGEFLKQEVDEISFGGSAGTEQIKNYYKTLHSFVGGYSTIARTTGLATAPKEKHISITYETQICDVEISSFFSLDALIQAVENKFKLAIPIKYLYRLDNSFRVVVTDITDIREGFKYYVATVIEEKKKEVVDLDGFYKKLKERKRTDDEIKVVMNIFAEQGILFENLMETGELKITDTELKEYGLKAGGLRKTILSVIANLNKN